MNIKCTTKLNKINVTKYMFLHIQDDLGTFDIFGRLWLKDIQRKLSVRVCFSNKTASIDCALYYCLGTFLVIVYAFYVSSLMNASAQGY